MAGEDLSPGQALQQSIYFRLTGEVASKAGIVIAGFLVIPPRFPALGKERQCRLFRGELTPSIDGDSSAREAVTVLGLIVQNAGQVNVGGAAGVRCGGRKLTSPVSPEHI